MQWLKTKNGRLINLANVEQIFTKENQDGWVIAAAFPGDNDGLLYLCEGLDKKACEQTLDYIASFISSGENGLAARSV